MKYFLHKPLFLLVTVLIPFAPSNAFSASTSSKQNVKPYPIQEKLAELEVSSGGRIGISAINTGNNNRIQYRADERFPFCSTSKVIGAAAILKQSMSKNNLLQERIKYNKEDLVVYSPITEKHLSDGMTISELCEATVSISDNTAINLLVNKLGGPDAVTSFTRSLGDNTFRLDRKEPELNSAINGDLRDTTTPAAMEKTLQKLTLGDALAVPQRELLLSWMKGSITGYSQIRAGVPKEWIVGDKTGKGDFGTTNDMGVIWPTNCSPIVLVIYFTQKKKDAAYRNDIIASATRIVMNSFAHTDKCLNLKSL